MGMQPLEQWICDRCDVLIANVDDGWLEWISDSQNRKSHSFKIVHHISASPRRPNRDCYHYSGRRDRADNHLIHFVGPAGLANLLSFIDMGPYLDPDGENVPRVSDLREFTELARRLFLPYYEEARLYWPLAVEDGYFLGVNEVSMYLPDTLKSLVSRYGDDA